MTRARAVVAVAAAAAAAAAMTLGCGGGGTGAARPGDDAGSRTPRAPAAGDEGPDDGMEIESSRGRMDPAAIEAGLEPHKASLAACYTERVGKRRWLGGRVSLHWEILRDGTVAAVKLAESDLGAWPIERCLLEAARAATFGKPLGGGDTDFSLPLDFSSRGRVAVWDETRSERAVGSQLAALDACAAAKGVTGEPPEDVAITLYVGPAGKAQSVGFASARSVIEEPWADCAERAALAWRLPDPKGEIVKLAVRYRAL